MLEKLRASTQELHQQIEGENTADLIMNHRISLEEYKKLLLQNYVAYKITEEEIKTQIPEYTSDKTENLAKDLAELNVDFSIAENYKHDFKINTNTEALGAWYVVEGSSLGGMMIAKNIEECEQLSSIHEHHFFNGKRQSVDGWRQFTKDIKKKNFSEEEENQAIEKAKETFQFFGKIFREI
ncbi:MULTISPECIES: biliverdin-producing heme oxygenase [Mesonia]|uniref:Uncharacterized protein n=1 Tax=Mesonia oceanica TaxID=2687242 RepID=A0AC61YAS7_9FLAO|nr:MULTISPECIES: biliverdin-producing heme oxygenase [Mesonia]MAN29382.1 heme oxygenase [Mesonia sp.]MAQ41587.1 heme oxygenase [Mesonia sp.]VVV01425.1 hypothetical protein FVB9532_02717 [Mesonia oceanica]|tara:strand:+ start:26064 stop:26609 length:546 start_codon:yes stop_codon:yes gene_type:complete